jgi:signal peptidase II
MTNRTPRAAAFLLALGIYLIDQLTKFLVTTRFGLDYEGASYDILPFFQFTLTYNHGVALGLFEAGTAAAQWTLTGILAAITAGVAFWVWREENRADALGLGMILGGALGNLTDRARFGYVVDFADLHFGEFRPFLVFNVADAAITVGVLMLLVRAFFDRSAKPQVEK